MAKGKKKKQPKKRQQKKIEVAPISVKPKQKTRKQRDKERIRHIQEQQKIAKERKRASQLARDITSLAVYKPGMSFDEYASRLAPLVDLANERWYAIEDAGLMSTAIDKATDEAGGRRYFSTDFAEDIPDLIAEATRLRVFINDEASTILGASLEMTAISAEKYRGKFGGQWGRPHMAPDIDEELAKEAFANYRRIAEAAQAFIKNGYGSENLIIAMYDAEVRGFDSFMYGMDLLDKYYQKKQATWQERFKEESEETDKTVEQLWKEYRTHGARMGRL